MADQKPKNIFIEGPVSAGFIAESIQRHSRLTTIGGHSLFLGQVRADVIGEQKVEAIEYSTYQDMALEKMHAIRESIFAKYPLTCMHVYHSLGRVLAGEISLFVFTSSAHRQAAMEACQELVDRIKGELPIWGKEIFADASYQWKENQ